MELLHRIPLWRLRAGIAWKHVHILQKIKNREITWREDWDQFEQNIYDKVLLTILKQEKANINAKGNTNDTVWFCKKNNRSQKAVIVKLHIQAEWEIRQKVCNTFVLKDKVKASHPECSPDCPNKEL